MSRKATIELLAVRAVAPLIRNHIHSQHLIKKVVRRCAHSILMSVMYPRRRNVRLFLLHCQHTILQLHVI